MVSPSSWRIATLASTLFLAACETPEQLAEKRDPCLENPDAACHLVWAEDLVANIDSEHNTYGSHPSFLHWAGVDGATMYENQTKCGSFVTLLLMQAYGYTESDFNVWFNSTSPDAADYHTRIASQIGFDPIEHVAEIHAGDLIAIDYSQDPTASAGVSGHVAIAKGKALAFLPTEPIVQGTMQYAIEIVDSTSDIHGPSDSRKKQGDSFDTGAGSGFMRLYADEAGNIVGHSWSTSAVSTFYNQSQRNLVVGRIQPRD